jgi:hypothetical protein
MSRSETVAAENRRGVIIMAGCGLALAGVGGWLFYHRQPTRDISTGCQTLGQARHHHIVIVDLSDGFGRAQVATLRAALSKLASEVALENRLSIYLFDGAARTSAPQAVFERCQKGDGTQASSLTTTVSQVKKQYEKDWRQPLQGVLDRLGTAQATNRSELVQFLSDVAGLMAYRANREKTHITLYSNLEEHGDISFHQKKPVLSSAEFTGVFKRIIKDRLQGLSLDVVYLPAPKTTTDLTRRTKAAWTQALSASGASFTIKDL